MNQFTFTGREKLVSFILMGIGVLCIVLNLLPVFGDDEFGLHSARLWTNILHNAGFYTGIGLMILVLMAAHITGQSGWHTVFKRIMEAISSFIPVGGVFLIIIMLGTVLHWHDIYHWNAPGITDPAADNYDSIIAGKAGFLNIPMYVSFTVGMILAWWFFHRKLRSLSLEVDDSSDVNVFKRYRAWSAAFLPIGGVTVCTAVWFWFMSIEPHWYSTLYAWYGMISWLVSGVAIMLMLIFYLQSKGYYGEILPTHVHDLSKYLFGFSVFWTYLWFSQFMLIWYGNVGEETVHFYIQRSEFSVVFYGMLALNFFLPFLVLMRNSTKWKQGSVIFAGSLVVIGHWLDFFLMTKTGVWTELKHHAEHAAHHGDDHGAGHATDHAEHAVEAAHHAASGFPEAMAGFNYPGLEEFGIFLGFTGLFIYVFFSTLSKASLVPTKNDPFMEESLHHQGGPLGPELGHEGHH